MQKAMQVLAGFAFMFMLTPISLFAQNAVPKSATDVPAVDIQNLLKSFPPGQTSDQLLRLVDIGKYNVGVAAVTRAATAKGGGAVNHDKITEVYYVLRGFGMQVTGGTLVDPGT